MSAVEILKQVKAMPAEEREKFLMTILALEEASEDQHGKHKRVKWPDIEARAKRIFGNRIMPNLVLREREETPF